MDAAGVALVQAEAEAQLADVMQTKRARRQVVLSADEGEDTDEYRQVLSARKAMRQVKELIKMRKMVEEGGAGELTVQALEKERLLGCYTWI